MTMKQRSQLQQKRQGSSSLFLFFLCLFLLQSSFLANGQQEEVAESDSPKLILSASCNINVGGEAAKTEFGLCAKDTANEIIVQQQQQGFRFTHVDNVKPEMRETLIVLSGLLTSSETDNFKSDFPIPDAFRLRTRRRLLRQGKKTKKKKDFTNLPNPDKEEAEHIQRRRYGKNKTKDGRKGGSRPPVDETTETAVEEEGGGATNPEPNSDEKGATSPSSSSSPNSPQKDNFGKMFSIGLTDCLEERGFFHKIEKYAVVCEGTLKESST